MNFRGVRFAVSSLAVAASLGAASMASAAEREVIPLTTGWKFHKGEAAAASTVDFFDSAWDSVVVPHTWNRVGYYKSNDRTHIHKADGIEKYQGVGWYRLRFDAPKVLSGRKAWLEFDAISRKAEIWLNGEKVGSHAGGFSRFRLDVTGHLKPGADNLLAIRVDNAKPQAGSDTADILPLVGDFFVHGGIYRPARMVLTGQQHFDLLDAGGAGVYASTRSVGRNVAEVAVKSRLRSETGTSGQLRLRLQRADGTTAATSTQAVAFGSGSVEVDQVLKVTAPHLWDGVNDPYLYTLVAELLTTEGQVQDTVSFPFGIRTFHVDPKKGFFLNGKPYFLKGVGYHQDQEGKGWALTPDDVRKDVEILREMGVNSIRLTHYQHGPVIHELADRYGLILWDEIPLVSAWTVGGAKTPTAGLVENARQQMAELIKQNYNHPSVVTWGIANEVDFGNSLPAFLTGTDGIAPDPMALLAQLNSLSTSLDPTRPTALATCCEGRVFAEGVDVPTTAAAGELGGANRYFGWYFGEVADLDAHLDQLHAKRPEQPLSVTEYGAGGGVSIHTDNVLGGPIDSRGWAQPEEYMSYIHEESWKILKAKPYLWAAWIWNGFDFATTIRTEGDAQDINTKGLVTYDRVVRKDPYYFYKASWTKTPTVHIAGRRYTDRAYRVTEVRVYSNAETTTLFLNGRALGTKQKCPDQVCVWENIPLEVGDNAITAVGAFKAALVRDTVNWSLRPERIASVRIDSGAIVVPTPQAADYGSDNFFAGGRSRTVDVPPDYGKPAVVNEIVGAPARAIAATFREGAFLYRVPLADGRYTLRLRFVEPSARPGERSFDIYADTKKVITALDIAKEAGVMRELTKEVPITVTGGVATLRFAPLSGAAIVSAIEFDKE